jgi:hypothetical protein
MRPDGGHLLEWYFGSETKIDNLLLGMASRATNVNATTSPEAGALAGDAFAFAGVGDVLVIRNSG